MDWQLPQSQCNGNTRQWNDNILQMKDIRLMNESDADVDYERFYTLS